MKISELNTKSFLSAAGAAANSYVLVNYEDNTTSEPVTYKATINELSKAVAKNLNLVQVNSSGRLKTMGTSNGTYTTADVEVPVKQIEASSGNTVIYDKLTDKFYAVTNCGVAGVEEIFDKAKMMTYEASDVAEFKDASGNNIPVVTYDATHSALIYTDSQGNSESLSMADVGFSSNGGGGTDVLDNGAYEYLLIRDSDGDKFLDTKDSQGYTTTLGTPIIASYSYDGYKLQTINGSEVQAAAAPPVTITLSETEFSYLIYDNSSHLLAYGTSDNSATYLSYFFPMLESGGQEYHLMYYNTSDGTAAMGSSQPDNSLISPIGHLIYYSDTSSQFGYINTSGNFVQVNITPVAQQQ